MNGIITTGFVIGMLAMLFFTPAQYMKGIMQMSYGKLTVKDKVMCYIPIYNVVKAESLYTGKFSIVLIAIGSNLLLSGVTETAYTSYITPYYIILENLIRIINEYNQDPNQDGDDSDKVVQYETVRQSGGVTRTKGLIRQYFMSREFMEDEKDITGLRLVYGLPVSWSRLSEDSNPAYVQLDTIMCVIQVYHRRAGNTEILVCGRTHLYRDIEKSPRKKYN